MRKPDFLIVGVARCGTTSLYNYLKQHPEIRLPSKKEPKYFSSIDINFPLMGPGDKSVESEIIKDKNKYYELFQNIQDDFITGEASSDYFYYHNKSIKRIKEELGDIKIIILLRNPVERTISAYNNCLRDSRESLSLNEAISIENQRISSNYDWMWAYKSGSLYYEGVSNFLSQFSKVHIMIFENFIEKPNFEMNKVLEFLELKNDFNFDYTAIYSKSGKPKNTLIKIISSRSGFFFIIRKIFIKIFPRNFLEILASRFFKKVSFNTKTKSDLYSFFKSDIDNLEKLTKINLSKWKRR